MKRLVALSYSFFLLNWAAVMALYYSVIRKKDLWSNRSCTHRRRQHTRPH
jgi:hypothetical protein